MSVCMYVCMCVCVYIYIYIYIYTNICTQITSHPQTQSLLHISVTTFYSQEDVDRKEYILPIHPSYIDKLETQTTAINILIWILRLIRY